MTAKKDIPLVSVIIPTYNRSQLLLRTVRSVQNQTYKNLEILIVDDCSSDNTKEIVGKIVQEDKRIKYFRQRINKGGSAARNLGIKKAKGCYIAFLDDDDEWYSHKIEKQVESLEKRDTKWGGVYCGYRIVLKKGLLCRNKKAKTEGNLTKEIFQMKPGAFGSTLLVRREVIEKIGCFDENFKRHQDYEFLIRFFRKFKLAAVEEVLATIYGHNNPKAESMIKVKEHFFSVFKDDFNQFNLKEQSNIYALNYLQIANLFAHERNIFGTIKYLSKSLKMGILNPTEYLKVLFHFLA